VPAKYLLAPLGVATVAACLAGCGSGAKSALQLASSHPDSLAAAQYVSIRLSDLPSGYSSSQAPGRADSEDAAQTLAEYRCEHLTPPTGPAALSSRTPDFTDPTGTTELHETTTVFPSTAAAASHLALELNSRYPTCKATAFRIALVASAPTGERIGFVTVHVSDLPARFGDRGVEVEGLSTLALPGGVSALATSDLVVLIRGHLAAELSIQTEGQTPNGLRDNLTSDLATRLAQIVPNPSRN
jgi:hypothetical protein